MSYKLNQQPSPRAYNEEKADYWEIVSIENPSLPISQLNIAKNLAIQLDEINHDGTESEDDKLVEELNEVFEELRLRKVSLADKYPFKFNSYSVEFEEENSIYKTIYTYLLLCTRLNMSEYKIQNGHDGTRLFEELCCYVSEKYFGKKSQSFVFGTAVTGTFANKVKDLIKKIGEGKSFKNPNANIPTAKDDSVDVVTWIEFADKKASKLIAFGQCKTGTSWRDSYKTLKPEEFCLNWFAEPPIIYPLPIIFLTDTLNQAKNFVTEQRSYLFFNRFRIQEYIEDDIDQGLIERIDAWVDGAKQHLTIKN